MSETSRLTKECSSPENKEGYIFIIKEKAGREEDHLLPHSWVDIKASIISSSFGPLWFTQDGHDAIQIICLLAKGWSQLSPSIMSDSVWPHGLQRTRPLCPSPSPGVRANSCPLSWWCHPITSSSVIPWKVGVCVLLTRSCQTFWDSMDCNSPDSSVPGILQARKLE